MVISLQVGLNSCLEINIPSLFHWLHSLVFQCTLIFLATLLSQEALVSKGVGLGTVLAFMMAVTALSLPSLVMIKKVIKTKLLLVFIAVVVVGIVFYGLSIQCFRIFTNVRRKNMEIKVLGSGCKNCKKLLDVTKNAVQNLKVEANIIYVTDMLAIARSGGDENPSPYY